MRRPIFALMGLLLFAVSSYFGYAIVTSQVAQTRATKVFQPVKAIVISSYVRSHSPSDMRGSRTYNVAITYRYKIAGHEYSSNRYSYMDSGFEDYATAKKLADQYPSDDQITVYYDPENPAQSVIYRGAPGLPAVVLAFPLALFGLIGLIMSIHGFGGVSLSRQR